jgi:hypothetical protein
MPCAARSHFSGVLRVLKPPIFLSIILSVTWLLLTLHMIPKWWA